MHYTCAIVRDSRSRNGRRMIGIQLHLRAPLPTPEPPPCSPASAASLRAQLFVGCDIVKLHPISLVWNERGKAVFDFAVQQRFHRQGRLDFTHMHVTCLTRLTLFGNTTRSWLALCKPHAYGGGTIDRLSMSLHTNPEKKRWERRLAVLHQT